jgi:hypothetical protein
MSQRLSTEVGGVSQEVRAITRLQAAKIKWHNPISQI